MPDTLEHYSVLFVIKHKKSHKASIYASPIKKKYIQFCTICEYFILNV